MTEEKNPILKKDDFYPPGAFASIFCHGCDGTNCPGGYVPNAPKRLDEHKKPKKNK